MKKTIDPESLTIDETLDHLIENAEMLEEIKCNPALSHEAQFLDGVQESLISHLVDLDTHQRRPLKRHVEKIQELEELDSRVLKTSLDKIAPHRRSSMHLRKSRLS